MPTAARADTGRGAGRLGISMLCFAKVWKRVGGASPASSHSAGWWALLVGGDGDWVGVLTKNAAGLEGN